ncbi:hypothetical protein C8R45DRAFT_1218638 [Mycena sanguinolenta]|nr:hypothetical protein C8R45DRAFT_1218638 [Mycena sanguinolenta]
MASHSDDGNRENILDFDGGVDDRDSASSSSSEGVDNPHDQPPSTSQLYATPDGRSYTSSIDQRVKNKLMRLCGGRVCILTKESTPQVSIEAAHLVPRAASGTLLAKLEFSFGLNYRQLHIDTTGNLIYIRVDLHRSFDHIGWLLLPQTNVIETIQAYTQNPNTKNYKQVFAETKFTYRVISLRLFQDQTTVFQRISKGQYQTILPVVEPFSPPTVESHANPFFVIANAGPKLDEHFALLPIEWQFNSDILAVLGLWSRWKTVMPTQEWLKRPGSGPGGKGMHGGGDGPGDQTGSRPARDSPTPRSSRSAHFSAGGAGASMSGNTGARAAADLPQLHRDNNSDTTESDILTQDAVRAVGFVDRSEFFEKWLCGVGCSTVGAVTPANHTEVHEMLSGTLTVQTPLLHNASCEIRCS